MSLKALHNTIGKLNLPPLITWLKARDGSATHFHFKGLPGTDGHVALTIDDGLCRQEKNKSLATEVCDLLQEHSAKATFFLIGNYVQGMAEELKRLVADGHELANHGMEDAAMSHLDEAEFERQLLQTNNVLEPFLEEGERVRWFRSPQGMYTQRMQGVVERHNLGHALADCYCDDYAVEDPKWVAETLLQQAQSGSVIIIHMPERGHWEHTLEALRLLLEGLEQRGLKPITLSQLVSRIRSAQPAEAQGRWWVCRHEKLPCQENPNHIIHGRSYDTKHEAEMGYKASTVLQACVLLDPQFEIIKSYPPGGGGGRFEAMVKWAREK